MSTRKSPSLFRPLLGAIVLFLTPFFALSSAYGDMGIWGVTVGVDQEGHTLSPGPTQTGAALAATSSPTPAPTSTPQEGGIPSGVGIWGLTVGVDPDGNPIPPQATPLPTSIPNTSTIPPETQAPTGGEATPAPVATLSPRQEADLAEYLQSPYGVTPSSHQCGRAYCYWETPMDIRNTQSVWQMLTQPILSIKGSQRDTQDLYAAPDASSEIIGEVTRSSQGIHLLETLPNGWSHIECYSDRRENGKGIAWNQLMEGYIPSDQIEIKQVQTTYGLVADKLAQRMYVFQEGEMIATLRISTGKPTKASPGKETTSGEFLLCSPVGVFVTDGGAHCDMSIRFNRGNLLHEIPYFLLPDGTPNYQNSLANLGKRASDGCIRVQRMRTVNGVNMRWLWNNLRDEMGTRLVLWEDVQGRALPLPDSSTPLYCSSKDSRYHVADTCYGIRPWQKPFTMISYGDLSHPAYQELTPCEYCVPPMTPSEIAIRNQAITPSARGD